MKQRAIKKTLVMAASVGLASACGSVEKKSEAVPDAGEQETMADSDTTPLQGECSVERSGTPVRVVFHDADGSPITTLETDEDGIARFDRCVDGGMVTLVNPVFLGGGGTKSRLVTVQGMSIGDHVVFDVPFPEPPTSGPLSITVQNDDDLVSIEPDHYVANLGDCTGIPLALDGDNGGEIQVDDLEGCLGYDTSNYSVVSIARSDLSFPRGFARVDSNDLESPVTASGGTWVAYAGPTLLGLENMPEGVVSGFSVISPLIDGVFYNRDTSIFDADDETLDADVWPDAIVDEHRVALSVRFADDISTSTRMRTATAPTTIDLSEFFFAKPSSLVVDVSEPMRPSYRWSGGDERAVLARTEITWTEAEHQGAWIVVAPGNPGETVVPLLPDALVDLGPTELSTQLAGRMLLIDRGITYSQWLTRGISSTLPGEGLVFHETYSETEGGTLRSTGFTPED